MTSNYFIDGWKRCKYATSCLSTEALDGDSFIEKYIMYISNSGF